MPTLQPAPLKNKKKRAGRSVIYKQAIAGFEGRSVSNTHSVRKKMWVMTRAEATVLMRASADDRQLAKPGRGCLV
jgi:hypothetical protein